MPYSADQLPNGLDAKTTPVDADVVPVGDSADSNRARKVTWANIKATLKTYFDTLYPTGSGTSTGSNTGDQTITLTSDVTGSGTGSFATTIANGAVSLAKMANMATASLIYRKTAGSGAPEVQTLATLKTDLGLTGTNSGDQTTIAGITGTKAQFDTAVTDGDFLYVGDVTTNATHTGDVTGATTLTIDKTAITGKTAVTALGADYILISDTSDTGNLKKALASDLIGSGGVVEGTAVLSTGEVGGTKFLREDGDGTCSWQTIAAGGDMVLASVQSVTGKKTFDTTKLAVKGSSTGVTDFASANASATDYTLTLPAVTGTLVTGGGTASGTNTGDNAVNSNYSGLVTNATHTGDATGSGALTVVALNGTNLAALGTGVLKNTTTTGVPFISKVALTEPATSATLTILNGKTLTANHSLTLAGTDGTTMTFPTTSKTIAANDGSNLTLTSQATGDLITAASATSAGRLADVAVGQVLVSGGVGVAPAYSATPSVTSLDVGAGSTDTTISRSSAGIIAVEGVAVPTISSTHTLTNKRVTPRTGTTTSHATPTINTDNVDFYSITAQTEAITSFTTNLSGTPTEGQKLWIAITGTAARAITWGASFEASTVALPTTTVTTARLDCGFVWNTVTSKWRCIASA